MDREFTELEPQLYRLREHVRTHRAANLLSSRRSSSRSRSSDCCGVTCASRHPRSRESESDARHEGAAVEHEALERADLAADLFLLGRERRAEPDARCAEGVREGVGLRGDVAGEVGEGLEGVLELGLVGGRWG